MLLGARGSDERAPDVATLSGETSKGFPVTLVVVDGEVRQLSTTASVYCRFDHTWYVMQWMAAKGSVGRFSQDGESFRVKGSNPVTLGVMRGELADDDSSARGAIYARWRARWYTCEGTVRFSARGPSVAEQTGASSVGSRSSGVSGSRCEIHCRSGSTQ